MFDVMVNSRTFKALNLGEKNQVLSRMRGNPELVFDAMRHCCGVKTSEWSQSDLSTGTGACAKCTLPVKTGAGYETTQGT